MALLVIKRNTNPNPTPLKYKDSRNLEFDLSILSLIESNLTMWLGLPYILANSDIT